MDAAPPLTEDLVADWARTVARLGGGAPGLGPLPPDDPIAMLATATTGAVHTPGAAPVAGAVAAAPGGDRSRDVAALNQVAYDLAHRVRVQVTDERVGAWLLAGETALDAAIHAPWPGWSATAAGLAVWQDALAAVQTAPQAAIVRVDDDDSHGVMLKALRTIDREPPTPLGKAPECSSLLVRLHVVVEARAVEGIEDRGSAKSSSGILMSPTHFHLCNNNIE